MVCGHKVFWHACMMKISEHQEWCKDRFEIRERIKQAPSTDIENIRGPKIMYRPSTQKARKNDKLEKRNEGRTAAPLRVPDSQPLNKEPDFRQLEVD